jgi:hypothetical protein
MVAVAKGCLNLSKMEQEFYVVQEISFDVEDAPDDEWLADEAEVM